MRFVEVHEDYPCENRERLIYSELAVARESAATPCIQQRLRGRQVAGQLYCGKRGRGVTWEVWVWARRIIRSGVIFHGAFRIPRLVLSWAGEGAVIVDPSWPFRQMAAKAVVGLALLMQIGVLSLEPVWPLYPIKSLKPLFVSLSC